MVDSPISANPPVPESRRVASRFASSRNTPIATMRNDPQASSATVARLRLRRRAQPRTASPPSVSRAAPACALEPMRGQWAAGSPSPPLEERAGERRPSFSSALPARPMWQPAGTSPRTAVSSEMVGLLSPTLSSKGEEGDVTAACEYPDACTEQAPPSRANRPNQAAAHPRPATSTNAPAPKKAPAFALSPCTIAQTTIAPAPNPEPTAIHAPRLWTLDFGLWTSPASSSRADWLACFRKVSQIVSTATRCRRTCRSPG